MILDICIPTYNRCDVLIENLSILMKIKSKSKFTINIIISDNNSTDKTVECVTEQFGSAVKIFQNNINVGVNRNIAKVLQYSEGDYAWLLGSDDSIFKEIDNILLDIEENSYDLIVLGQLKKKQLVLTTKNEVLDICEEMTWISALIFNTAIIKTLDFEKFYDTWFPHTGAILDFASKKSMKILYKYNDGIVKLMNPGVVSYTDNILEMYTKGKANLYFSLSSNISVNDKIKCYKKSTLKLLDYASLRSKNQFSMELYNEYKEYIDLGIGSKAILVKMIAMVPTFILRLARKVYIRFYHIDEVKQG